MSSTQAQPFDAIRHVGYYIALNVHRVSSSGREAHAKEIAEMSEKDTTVTTKDDSNLAPGDVVSGLESSELVETPRLRIIQDPISRPHPEMQYRKIQYVVEEADWTTKGEEVRVESAEER